MLNRCRSLRLLFALSLLGAGSPLAAQRSGYLELVPVLPYLGEGR